MNKKMSPLLILLVLAVPTLAFGETDYTHGHGALQIFDEEGMKNTPQWVMVWIMFMASTFVVGLFFAWKHGIARWVVGCFIAGLIAGEVIGRAFNIPPLSGYIALIHIIFWSPALYQLLSKRPFLGAKTPFSIWSGVMTFVILFSFVFDFRDAFLFLRHIL